MGVLDIAGSILPEMLGPLGIFGPILLLLMGLWLGRGDRSPRYVKAVLWVLLLVLFLILFQIL